MFRRSQKIAKARAVLNHQGWRGLYQLCVGALRVRLGLPAESKRRQRRLLTQAMPLPRHLLAPITIEEALAVDWTRGRSFRDDLPGSGPYRFNWVIPSANAGSGGHQNIFRFVRHLEQQGHECRIYIHDPLRQRSIELHEQQIREHFVEMQAPVLPIDGPMLEADAIFATSWPTAYPVYSDPSDAKRFYFVQDFEPLFYPLGSEYVLAENTYRFGFHGITAGAWLSTKLSDEYGMRCDHYEFGAEPDLYSLENTGNRNAILFYARPPTPRRAWELGVLTLAEFSRMRPDVEIHMAGWPLRGFKAGFRFVDHGVLRLDELNDLYNKLGAALVLSLTNCSLLPLELLAAGCIPVMNDGPNNRLVVDNPHVRYCPPSPHELARELAKVMDEHGPELAHTAADSVAANRWEDACEHFEAVILGGNVRA